MFTLEPYTLAHSIGLLSEGIVSLYVLFDIIRTRERRLLLSLLTFLMFALTELALLYYYSLNGAVFLIYAETTVDIFSWFLTLSLVLLSSVAVATLAIYLMEFRVFYLVPLMVFLFVFYVLFYTYYLFRAVFLGYIRSIDIIRATLTAGIMLLFIIALTGEALFGIIYRKTKSLRVLSFILGSAIIGFVNLGGEFLFELLPMTLTEQPLDFYETYTSMMVEWPLNLLYIVVSLVLLLGQTRVFDSLAKLRRPKARKEKYWIEKMMEEV
ncbi:MAG: hypothetical protein QI197_06065 [Candidatus Korarchaeota archaeon]|nr:hypothetical protein [Candidatus Korarchaeota archaeon]